MESRPWQVLIADLRSSRAIPARERPRVDRALRTAVARVLRRYGAHFRLVPELLRGDELQAVLKADAPALAILTYLRAQLALEAGRGTALRAGLGRGAIVKLSSRGPFASEGEAFHRARAALDAARRSGGARLTGWVTGDEFVDMLADVLLALTDSFASRWTLPQWEAVAGRLEDKGLHQIARGKGVSFQSVSKRLLAASWNEVQRAIELLESAARSAEPERVPARVRPVRVRSRRVESAHLPARG
jgi:hypothetical protein